LGSPIPRLFLSGLLLILLLPLSQCSSKQNLPVRPVKPEEAARLSAATDPWPERWQGSKLKNKNLPEDRLEALGDLALEARDYENSLASFIKILKDHPERYDLHYKVGVILLLTGELPAARQALAEVLVHRPDMLEAHEALGLVLFQEKQYQQAIDEFQAVLSQEPRRAKTRYLLGITFLEAGQPARAIPELKEAATLDPRQVTTLTALGQAYLQQKDYQQAITWLQKAQVLAPQNQKINYHLGMALAALKRYPEALEAFLRAGDEAQAYNNIGVHYYMNGRYEEAAKCFQRAIELRPSFYSEAQVNLQRALEKLHQTRQNDS
jgi:tetratricopeptide (TPR) repeat protein